MKIIIDIPKRSMNAAKAYLLSQCDNEKNEQEIEQLCEKLEAQEEPVPLNFDSVKEDMKHQLNDLYLALSVIAVSTLALNEEEDEGEPSSEERRVKSEECGDDNEDNSSINNEQ